MSDSTEDEEPDGVADSGDEEQTDGEEWISFTELDDVDDKSDPFTELDDVDDGSDPFSELDDAPLGERTPATDDDLFEEMEREELDDEDAVVEQVFEGDEAAEGAPEATESMPGPESNGSAGGPTEEADHEVEPDRDEVIVPKRRYCEGCQYFSEPPEAACEHPGTDILELVDADHFLVADCPVVEWRRDLEAYPDPSDATTDPRE